jgi:S-adenosylmethionine hydrolase
LNRFPVLKPYRHLDGHITAHVQHIDRFGNCATDVPGEWLQASAQWRFEVGQATIERVGMTFGDVADGELVALVDSTGYVAIAERNGNAAERLQLSVQATIEVWPVPDR